MFAAQFLPHLANRFHERQRLDVAHRAADFNDRNVNILRDLLHSRFNFVGDVRNDLHGLAQIIATPFLGDDLLVEPAGGPVIVARKFGVGEALIVPQVEVGLSPIIGYEHLAVLKRRHRARVHVQVGIELHEVDFEPAALQQTANGSRCQSLAQRGHNSARHKDVLRWHLFLALNCLGKFVQAGCTINYGRNLCGKKSKECARVDYRVAVSENDGGSFPNSK